MFLFGLETLVPVVLIGLIVLAVLALAGRGEPDPTGRRTYALYLFSVSFISLFVTLFATLAVALAIVRIALPSGEGPCTEFAGTVSCVQPFQPVPVDAAQAQPSPAPIESTQPVPPGSGVPYAPLARFDPDREHVREAVQAGLIAIAAALVLWFHIVRIRGLIGEEGFAESAARRTYQAYLYAVCFIAVLIALFAAAASAFGLFRIIAPGTTGPGFGSVSMERDDGIAEFVTAGLLALAAYGIFQYHWGRADALRPRPVQTAPLAPGAPDEGTPPSQS